MSSAAGETSRWEEWPREKLIVAEGIAIAAEATITKGQGPVTTYFFIFVKVMAVLSNDLRSYFESFLIFLAKRFNTAYDLLLVTGQLVRW